MTSAVANAVERLVWPVSPVSAVRRAHISVRIEVDRVGVRATVHPRHAIGEVKSLPGTTHGKANRCSRTQLNKIAYTF
eukprot:1786792-Pleurochrysis_carterae.AAC.2